MELKQRLVAHIAYVAYLLIVPYGIETTFDSHTVLCLCLLIVPYGIETWL